MATRTVKSDSGNDLKLQNNGGTGSVTITDAGNLTIDSPGDIILDADGADVTLKDDGTTFGTLKQVSGDLVIQPETGEQIVLNEDGGAAALTIDTSGNTEIAQNIEQADGKSIQTDEVRARDGDGLKLYDDGGAGIFVEDGGQVGIGTGIPSYNIDCKGTTGIAAQRSTDTDRLIMRHDGFTSYANSAGAYNNITITSQNNSGSATRMQIDGSGNIQFNAYGSGTLSTDASGNITASDERLKTKTRGLDSGLDLLNQLTPTFFKWKEDSGLDRKVVQESTDDQEEVTEYRGTEHLGFIAQEVQSIIPEASHSPDDPDRPLNYEDRGLIAVCVKSIQELSTKVNALENA